MELTEEGKDYLRASYSYYIDHKKEAEDYFKESWKTISDYAAKIWYWRCDKMYWTEEEIEDLNKVM